MLPYTGTVAVVVLWAGTIIGMRLGGLSLFDHRPISYLGVNPGSDVLFSATLIGSALLFGIFGLYVSSRLDLPKRFLAAYMIGQFAQIVAAVVPYGGSHKLQHTYAAFILAFSIPTYLYFFAQARLPKDFKAMANIIYKAEFICFVVGIGSFVFIKKVAPVTEILPALPFHTWAMWTGYLLTKRQSAGMFKDQT